MKVKCENCGYWLSSNITRKDPKQMFSFHWAYNRTIGICLSDKCGDETAGYTGDSSNKMSRIGNIERYCKFFKPLEKGEVSEYEGEFKR